MTLPRIHIGRPQRLAALLLLAFLAQCLWVLGHQQLSTEAFTLHGDGVFAYRAVELPLALLRLAHGDDSRLSLFVLHLPFVFFALLLGGGLWWVTRRLYGNEGGFFALGLYCFCPAVVRMAVTPNNNVLAMWGLYGLIYTAIGVAHAMQGPRRRWRPRIVLLTIAIGFTAAAHLLAAIFGFIAALVFMLYLAERGAVTFFRFSSSPPSERLSSSLCSSDSAHPHSATSSPVVRPVSGSRSRALAVLL